MKIDAINFGAFNNTPQVLKAEESNSAIDEYDDTRYAKIQTEDKTQVSNPIEHKNGTIEDLKSKKKSTEKMAQSYGFANVAEAQAATSNTSSESTSAVSAVSSASSGGINA